MKKLINKISFAVVVFLLFLLFLPNEKITFLPKGIIIEELQLPTPIEYLTESVFYYK